MLTCGCGGCVHVNVSCFCFGPFDHLHLLFPDPASVFVQKYRALEGKNTIMDEQLAQASSQLELLQLEADRRISFEKYDFVILCLFVQYTLLQCWAPS